MDVEAGAMPGWWMVERNFLRPSGYWKVKPSQIELTGNVILVEVLNYNNQEAKSGLGGAAAGAVLGFLVAGPMGTILGAAAGRGSSKQVAQESFRVRVTLKSGRVIMGKVSPTELNSLEAFLI